MDLFIPSQELWDERKEEMIYTKATTLHLEHSLISVSKWEAKWHVPFLDTKMDEAQSIDYIRCMTINKDVDPNVYLAIRAEHLNAIMDYINDPMTATTIKDDPGSKKPTRFITSELIYYYMIQYGIPHEFEKWHFNRLITLIRVCSEENKPKKKRSKSDIEREYEEINRRNKARLRTRG